MKTFKITYVHRSKGTPVSEAKLAAESEQDAVARLYKAMGTYILRIESTVEEQDGPRSDRLVS